MEKVAPLPALPLDVWTFPSGSTQQRLEAPRRHKEVGCYDYYCMDMASLLPVVMLDVRPGNAVLDTCAAPGTLLNFVTKGGTVGKQLQDSHGALLIQ